MPRARQAAVAVAALRIAYGAALVAAPARTTRSWLGPDGAADGAQVAIRGLGAREVILHSVMLWAAISGRPVQAWLVASIGGDLADVAATFGSSRGLPDGAAPKTAAVAGGSAALSAAVLAAVDA